VKPYFALLLLCICAVAQDTTAILEGRILDPSGSSIPDAVVQTTNSGSRGSVGVVSKERPSARFQQDPLAAQNITCLSEIQFCKEVFETMVSVGQGFQDPADPDCVPAYHSTCPQFFVSGFES